MKRLLLSIIISCSMLGMVQAQVETHFYKQGETPNIRKSNRMNASVKEMPSFDVQSMIKEDREMAGEDVPYRFGKGFDVSYTLDDGIWEQIDSGRVWSMTFSSKDALSLNFIFHNFKLPDGATLNIVNEDNTFIYGPVTQESIPDNGIMLTDIIPGSKATILLYEPREQTGRSSLTIKKVVHGYRGINYDDILGAIGASHTCNVPAENHPEYSKEYDAIALLMKASGTELCSGSLLMSTDFSFTPSLCIAIGIIIT